MKIIRLFFILFFGFLPGGYAQRLTESFNYPADSARTLDVQSGDIWKTLILPEAHWNIEKPNVIVVLSDDQGYGDFACHGNPVLKTPALDKLYHESVRFSNFHVSPLCTPSRGQLLSGLDAMRNKASTVLQGRGIMRRDILTMPQIFKDNGYRTGIFGKWHLGDSYPDRPMDRGFEKSVWIKGWGLLSESEYNNDYYQTRYIDNLDVHLSDQYCTDLWFSKAIEWMDKMYIEKQPFFTYIALNAPHAPFHAPQEDYDFYRSQVNDNQTASFLGMIRSIDRNMEYLDRWLESRNIKDNTLIVFMNDNGGTGGVNLYNAGMRGEKGSNYDGGHRAACFIRWPNGELGAPRTLSYPSQIQDILPTFIDLLNLKLDKSYGFDGESLKYILGKEDINEEVDNDRMFVVQQGGPVKYNGCVVWDSWRLVGENELYDLNTDRDQKYNVIAANPEIADKMKAFYESWWAKVSPDLSQLVHVIVGAEEENPVILTSGSWVGANVNTATKVAEADGGPKGGVWYIDAQKAGRYKLELSRWPFHLDRALTMPGPGTSIGNTKMNQGVSLPIEFGCVSINNNMPIVVDIEPGAFSVNIEIDIPAGNSTLQAWFQDENGQDICGAYYVKAETLF